MQLRISLSETSHSATSEQVKVEKLTFLITQQYKSWANAFLNCALDFHPQYMNLWLSTSELRFWLADFVSICQFLWCYMGKTSGSCQSPQDCVSLKFLLWSRTWLINWPQACLSRGLFNISTIVSVGIICSLDPQGVYWTVICICNNVSLLSFLLFLLL